MRRAGEGRCVLGAAAQQVDEGILEPRRRRLDLGIGRARGRSPSAAGPRSSITSRTLLPWITPSMISGRRSARARSCRPAWPGPCHQKTAALDARRQLLGRALIEDLPLVEQEHPGAALGFVEVGRAPDDADALVHQS